MTPQTELEVSGNLFTHPFAELIGEVGDARLGGSLRVDNKERKSIIYFNGGRIVFAASNARTARLFQILLDKGRISKTDLTKVPNFANDIELAANLERMELLTPEESGQLFSQQMERVIVDVLSWTDGNWTFSPLKRVRDGLDFQVDVRRILFDYARCMAVDNVLNRFRSLNERFRRSGASELGLALTPDEAFILSRAGEQSSTIADLVSISAMSEPKVLHTIYTLWLGGLIIREDWQPAFPREIISSFKSAKLSLKREAKLPVMQQAASKDPVEAAEATPAVPAQPAISLDDYLNRVDSAETYYDVLGLDPKVEIGEIKRAYFQIAKTFHPDKYHSEEAELFGRIQDAFASVMQANEALKTPEGRDLYDYRIRKELADRAKREAEGRADRAGVEADQAADNFERGFSLLMEGEVETALPFLARAVHYSPKVARYHAYYGKALSSEPEQRHKAEQEMQAALKLDPTNPTFRLLLAEFFIEFNLMKRAEGELNRLLAVFPSNLEAQQMLASLKAKA